MKLSYIKEDAAHSRIDLKRKNSVHVLCVCIACCKRERANLVSRAIPLKNGWGGKRSWHRLVTCPLVHPKILGVIN